jgi:alpha-tubulin suppressor-like RCC1 family protein
VRVTASGGVVCWGYNLDGQLGNGSMTNSATPVPVVGLTSGVTGVSVGDYSACAVTSGGGVVCWGLNAEGELGNNSTANSSEPVAVSGLSSGVTAVSVGTETACALTTTGGVECWGWNADGQLGNGSNTNSFVPAPVSGF